MKFLTIKLCSICLFLMLRRSLLQTAYATALAKVDGLRIGTIAGKSSGESWKRRLPWTLIGFRAVLGPGILWLGWQGQSGILLALIVVLALVSDIFDGILARRWHMDTPRLRRCDTGADTFFYIGVLLVVILRYPATAGRLSALFVTLIAVEIGQHIFAWIKFRHNASYHSIFAKTWGLLMAAGVIGLFAFGLNNWLLTLAVTWGIMCNVEGLIMSLLLPTWQRDVPTLLHAWRLRKELKTNSIVF